jgi:hypothetical protein
VTNIYSTPADVQALITIMTKLGLPPQKINVQYSGGAWNTHSVAPVDPRKLPERDIFSLQIGNQTNDINVAASLAQVRDTTMPAFYRAWYLFMQFSGAEISQAEFAAQIEQTAQVKAAFTGAIESMLGGA